MGDDGWRSQPKRMSEATIEVLIAQLARLAERQGRPFSVVLHGGEPLLLGERALDSLFARLRSSLPPACGLHLQTNGVLLTDRLLTTFARHGVGISISIDGPEATHDQFRVDLRGRGSHSRVVAAIEKVRAHPDASKLFSGLLAVIDPDAAPSEIYAFFKSTGTPSVDFLYRDGNHDILPYGKGRVDSTEYGAWMVGLLDCYLADPAPPRIRVLDDMIKLLLGGTARKEGVGVSDFGIVIVETDGTIAKNDTLKSSATEADRFSTTNSIHDSDLFEVCNNDEFEHYHEAQRPASPVCSACPELHVCGGGMPAHRWSASAGYANPSVFCADQKLLIARMREWIAALSRSAA
jgi:uncharacterized protein